MNFSSQTSFYQGNLRVPQFCFLALLLTLAACAADQFIAPALYSSSPLWAAAFCTALVWRRDEAGIEQGENFAGLRFSFVRLGIFVGAHVLLVSIARFLHVTLAPVTGTLSGAGWILATLKLSVLLPTLLLLPLKHWRFLAQIYAAEGIAAIVVLFTFFPSRILASIWPWYGQVLGRQVFFVSGLFAHGLSYTSALTPTIHGPDLDVTILLACSGISGIELFDYLFAFVVLLDWNRLRKGPTLAAYFAGMVAMFIGNGLRISSFVVLGNRGFANAISQFHLTAGWLFFTSVFLLYLSFTYPRLLVRTR